MSRADAMSFRILCVHYRTSHVSHPGMEALTRAEEKLGITLKEKQREAIPAVLGGRDVFVSSLWAMGNLHVWFMEFCLQPLTFY